MKPVVLLIAAGFCSSLLAQSPVFEVASVKPNLSGTDLTGINRSHGRLTVTNASLRRFMEFAFGVKDFQILGGPGWTGSDKFDIAAETDVSVNTNKQFEPPLQALLADRFHLKYHRETKELTVYSLMTAKNGPKLTEHADDGHSSTNVSSGAGRLSIVSREGRMATLADFLAQLLDRIVVNDTGLNGAYDYRLDWVPDQTVDSTGPSVYTALQEQLGLRLNSRKAPVEVIVIDEAEKPSEN